MRRLRRTATALALTLALPLPAAAQSPAQFLPREPVLNDPAREVAPPEAPDAAAPLSAPVPDAGPTFVLRAIRLDGSTAIPEDELAPIWVDLVGQPVTLATLDDIAARIGAAYRARGFVLSQAVLPAQTVEDGVVTIAVVEGFVDRVSLTGGADNQRALARQLFAPVEDERPARLATLERSILLARDTFGGTVETVIEPSPATFAAADLGVLIAPEQPSWFATVDNRGSRLFGKWTLGAGVRSYNLLGLNERLDGLVAGAPRDRSLAYGALIFDAPVPAFNGGLLDGGRVEISGDLSRSNPDLAKSGSPQDLAVILDEWNLRAGLIVPFVRTRSQNLFGRAGFGMTESTTETGFASTEATETDRLAILDLRLTWDVADRLGGVSLVDVGLRQGLDVAGAAIGSDSPAAGRVDFTAAQITLSRLQALGSSDWALFGEVIGQYATTVLPNAERFALGDATIGRGFAPGNTTGDSGYGGRLELRRYIGGAEGGLAAATELYVFGDYGRTYDRSGTRDGEQWESLGSAGIGARIDVRDWLTLTPEIARQTTGVATDTTETGLETRVYIGAIARF